MVMNHITLLSSLTYSSEHFSGVLVLADNGICCIGEFDKINESARSILLEVMVNERILSNQVTYRFHLGTTNIING